MTHARNKWDHLGDDNHREKEKKQRNKDIQVLSKFNYYKHCKNILDMVLSKHLPQTLIINS